jgi:MFS family permease
MQMTLLGWFVLERTDSAWFVGLVGFSAMIPMFALGMLGGVLADSINRKEVIRYTQTATFISLITMTFLLLISIAKYWHAYPVLLVMGTGWALDMPSRRSLIHDLLGRDGVTNAVALDSMGMSASMMIGPAAAGALITMIGVSGGHVVVTIMSGISIILISQLQISGIPKPSRLDRSVLQDLLEGLRYVFRQRVLRAMVLITVLANLLLFPYIHMVPVMARDVLGVGAGLMGLLQAITGLGSLIGAIVIASLPNVTHHGRFFIGGVMAAFMALFAFSQSTDYFLSLPILLVMGLGVAGFSSMQASLTMLVAQDQMRGKALGVVSLAIGSGPFGALLVGSLSDLYGPSFAIGVIAATGITLVGLIATTMSSIRGKILRETD